MRGLRRRADLLSAGAGVRRQLASAPSPPPTGPVVSSISPNTGPSTGGTAVTINGQRFDTNATVTIGGVEAKNVTFVSANTLTATTGPRSIGAADVAVIVAGQRGVLAGGFTYLSSSVTNAPPVISSLRAVGSAQNEPAGYANTTEELQVTATVSDAETAVSDMTFEWTADAGTLSGTGSSVKWTAPAVFGSPVTTKISVTVTEKYTGTDATGNPVPSEHKVSAVTSVSVHDSRKENSEMATAFLTDFANSSVSPEAAVRYFYAGCPGRQDELKDIQDNPRDLPHHGAPARLPGSEHQFRRHLRVRVEGRRRVHFPVLRIHLDRQSDRKTGGRKGHVLSDVRLPRLEVAVVRQQLRGRKWHRERVHAVTARGTQGFFGADLKQCATTPTTGDAALRVVLFSGGRGSGALTTALVRTPGVDVTLAINGYDDGASTGEVRRFLGDALGPSDFRKNASRLAAALASCAPALVRCSIGGCPRGPRSRRSRRWRPTCPQPVAAAADVATIDATARSRVAERCRRLSMSTRARAVPSASTTARRQPGVCGRLRACRASFQRCGRRLCRARRHRRGRHRECHRRVERVPRRHRP